MNHLLSDQLASWPGAIPATLDANELDGRWGDHGIGRLSRFFAAVRGTEVFVVHGHDLEMRDAVAGYLTQLGLEPIVLSQQRNDGKTVIEKLEESRNVPYAIVLISPDDVGRKASDAESCARPRARQNVMLELGYFMGTASRRNTAIIFRGEDIELPSDIGGMVRIRYTAPDGAWRDEIRRELVGAQMLAP